MQIQQSHDRTADFYDADANEYDSLRFVSRAGRYNHEAQISIVQELLPLKTGRTLEIGSGTGRFTSGIADRAGELFIFDVAQQMLETATRAVPSAEPALADATRLPIKSAAASTLVCLNVLNHIPDYALALREFSRVLEPGGLALLNFNNLNSPYFIPGKVVNHRKRAFRADVFSHWLTWRDFTRTMAETGLALTEARGHMPIPGRSPGLLVPAGERLDTWLRSRPSLAPAPILLATKR
jgi:ubiquinone/menaquinone biosynthesis C-methylase UbiE